MKINDMEFLKLMISRVGESKQIDQIIVATTVHPDDDQIVDFSIRNGLGFFRGSESNVLSRVVGAAEKYNRHQIVALTGDCPLIDPTIIDDCIKVFLDSDVDYLSNAIVRSYPDGMDTQVLKVEALRKSLQLTTDKLDLEHVTLFIRNNPQIFKLKNILAPENQFWPELGLTLDEPSDVLLFQEILNYFHPRIDFDLDEIIAFLQRNPSAVEINSKVKRVGDH
jgi:spore coat polysaccharide biosynthesis protein SpsF